MDLRPGSVEFKRTELRLTELNVSNDLRLIVKNGMPINDRTADNELRGSRQDRVVCPGMYVRPLVGTGGAKLHRSVNPDPLANSWPSNGPASVWRTRPRRSMPANSPCFISMVKIGRAHV